ncbi:MAG TPA: dihydrolipoamide acetyltransferase family protein [Ktedonobacteraceae bacterium]|nr:dihydrolipoamide acetyltransferase family protein [Ktedonobacteraceae bacterium]
MKTVEMPKMGDTMEEGKILRWLKKEGETVKKGESLAEVETDKVNIEIEAFASGILRKILIPEGSSATIGESIAFIGTADEPVPGESSATTQAAPAIVGLPQTESAKDEKVPDITTTPAATAPSSNGMVGSATLADSRTFISPVARRLAQEFQFDYAGLKGSGPNGRIIKLDIEAAIAQQQASPAPMAQSAAVASGPQAVAPTFTTAEQNAPAPAPVTETEDILEIPLTAMRRTIAKRLSQSMQTAPHFYVTSVIDMGKAAELRKQVNAYAATEPNPVKISFNDLIIRAAARAMARHPKINVSFAEDRILQKKQVHIGVAVALEQGLIVPVLRNADQRGILDIARESQRLVEAARTGKLRPEEFSGGTFTVSNLGMFDVESFTAVINPPESAILAIGSITPTPAVVDGQVVVRDRMKVTLSSDHRAIDGALAARFLQEIKRLLEEPFGLLL